MAASPISREGVTVERLAALVVAQAGTIVLALGEAKRWRQLQSYTLAPIELPGARIRGDVPPARGAAVTASYVFGQQARVLPSAYTYGRTAAHAIDRIEYRPSVGPAPLVYLERGLAAEDGASVPGHAEIYVYRGVLDGDPLPSGGRPGLLRLPLAALRQTIRGLPLDELLAMRGVVWLPASDAAFPDDLFVFVPAEYGERHVLRVAAKYGTNAVFQEEGESDHGA